MTPNEIRQFFVKHASEDVTCPYCNRQGNIMRRAASAGEQTHRDKLWIVMGCDCGGTYQAAYYRNPDVIYPPYRGALRSGHVLIQGMCRPASMIERDQQLINDERDAAIAQERHLRDVTITNERWR